MDLGINGKVALVGASSQGLGFAVAHRLASEEAKVILCARDERVLAEAAGQISKETDSPVFYQTCDVSEPLQVERLMEVVFSKFGQVDILVNNAGGPPPGTFETLSPDQWQKGFDLTLMSAINLIRHCLPGMKKSKWGRVLNMVSISAKQPIANLMLSNAIRAGVIGMAKTLADEVASYGILVNNLCPGFFRTGRMEAVIHAQAEAQDLTFDERLEKVEADIPLGRLGRPEEFADMAAFLVSERASFVTGGTFLADGGMYRGIM